MTLVPRTYIHIDGWGLAVGIAALLVLAAVGFAAWRFWPRPQPFASVSVSQITNVGTIEKVALSADGKFLAEVKNDNGQRTLWVKMSSELRTTALATRRGSNRPRKREADRPEARSPKVWRPVQI